MSSAKKSPESLWVRSFTVLASRGRLKEFYHIPRYEMKGIMRAHGERAVFDLFELYTLLANDQKEKAHQMVESIGIYRVAAMMMLFNRFVQTWRLDEGSKNSAHA